MNRSAVKQKVDISADNQLARGLEQFLPEGEQKLGVDLGLHLDALLVYSGVARSVQLPVADADGLRGAPILIFLALQRDLKDTVVGLVAKLERPPITS